MKKQIEIQNSKFKIQKGILFLLCTFSFFIFGFRPPKWAPMGKECKQDSSRKAPASILMPYEFAKKTDVSNMLRPRLVGAGMYKGWSRKLIQHRYMWDIRILRSWDNCYANFPLIANAGAGTGVCPNDSVTIGGNPSASGGTPPYTYFWQPAAGLNAPNSPNPKAYPSSQVNYTLTVTDAAGNSATDIVDVKIYNSPIVNAGSDQTIIEGTNTMLQASGAVNYFWTPTQTLYNQNSATPVAEPILTTTYCVLGVDANGCYNTDCMTVDIIPSDKIIAYNAFTPNGDGTNDVFYFGNLQKYPENKLEVFSRNGKLVYQASPYKNNWDGKINGVELPSATYYYILYSGNGKPNIKGAVTIIR